MSSTIKFTRAQRRQLQKLANEVDRITATDRRFFEQHPDWRHRVPARHPGRDPQQELLLGAVLWAGPGGRIFAAVCNVTPGRRIRLLISVEGAGITDLAEEAAAALFRDRTTPHQAKEIEAAIRKAAEDRREVRDDRYSTD